MSKDLLLFIDTIVIGIAALIWSSESHNLLIKIILAGLGVAGILLLARG